VFVVGSLVVRQIPVIDRQVSSVLDHADQGVTPILLLITVVNGVAEELFFRGALYAAVPRYPVVWSTVAYVVATLATGNFMLAFAAILLGVVVGLERRASGGVLAPILTHVTWSTVMLFALPLLF
jgi:membrane protease YdiL (CAAX protease family)